MSLPSLPRFLAEQILEAEERADRIDEPVIGLVVDNKDPDKLGRVKVRFPTLPENDSSTWAPISMPGAGEDRGWFFLPEVDDEVLVMFEHGDIRRPIVVGALWNGKDEPPEKNGGGNERRVLVSREGSRLELDDDAGTVTLEDGGGKGKVILSADGKITLESQTGDVCLQAPRGELNVAAQQIEITGTQSFKLETDQGLKIGSKAKTVVRAPSISVSGSQVALNSGGGGSPSEASTSTEEVPDPVGEG